MSNRTASAAAHDSGESGPATWRRPSGVDVSKADARHARAPVKPFIKWAGGKGQLIDDIRGKYPLELGRSINKYIEPFVGGGAVLFDILSSYSLDAVYISDINAELINAYIMIRDYVEAVTELLSDYQNEYLPLDENDRKAYYYAKRSRFNYQKTVGKNKLECAALFIFLNRTCFNGLYRVNRNKLFNVPIGSYKHPLICDYQNLHNVSKALKNTTIVCGDYKESEDFIDEHTFAYFDPPYRPLSATSGFTSYTETGFDDRAQIELARYVERLDKKGARVVVSNSDPKNANPNDDFFDSLYSRLRISRVTASRMINSDAGARGGIKELLISNY